MKRPALQDKQVRGLWMVFRALKVFGAFEKRVPDPNQIICYQISIFHLPSGMAPQLL